MVSRKKIRKPPPSSQQLVAKLEGRDTFVLYVDRVKSVPSSGGGYCIITDLTSEQYEWLVALDFDSLVLRAGRLREVRATGIRSVGWSGVSRSMQQKGPYCKLMPVLCTEILVDQLEGIDK